MTTQIRYCPDCCQNVTVTSGINWVLLVILLLFGVIPGIIYFAIRHKMRCPKCGAEGDRLLPQRKTFEECRDCQHSHCHCDEELTEPAPYKNH